MFEINQVFKPASLHAKFSGPVRLVAHNSDVAVLIPLTRHASKVGLVRVDYYEWVELIDEERMVPAEDPYAWVPAGVSPDLPPGALRRLRSFQDFAAIYDRKKDVIYRPHELSAFLQDQVNWMAEAKGREGVAQAPSKDTLKRWFFDWLRAGNKPMAIVEGFIREKAVKPQEKGKRRGRANPRIPAGSAMRSYELKEIFKMAYEKYIEKGGLTREDAYFATLKHGLKIPDADIPLLSTDMAVAAKYKFFSDHQFFNAMRRIQLEKTPENADVPSGRRGRATDGVYGPGHFEIDSTFFQVQLVSRIGRRNLVSRPTVYFVVDVYSSVIVGYVLSLENPSWAIAMLALQNAFYDKEPTFKRLGLDFVSANWPCHHLPVMLRADRAEFVTNRGQNFPQSLISVDIARPFAPKDKGTVEGINAQGKKKARCLPGSYKKRLERMDSDGKNMATYDLTQFEKELVEIIMELNNRPIDKRRIPKRAVAMGVQVGTRLELWNWGLKHAAGYTVRADENFVFEHLMAHDYATLTSRGIEYENQVYRCDLLTKLGMLQNAPIGGRPIEVAYNLLYAGEIFFKAEGKWVSAENSDVDVIKSKASFAELREYASIQRGIVDRAKAESFLRKESRASVRKGNAEEAKKMTQKMKEIGGVSTRKIRESRDADKRFGRGPGLNGVLDARPQPELSSQKPADEGRPPEEAAGGKRRTAVDFWKDE